MSTKTTLDEFEEAGLAALVRAGGTKQWFDGHFGAALLAGARLLRNPALPGATGLALSAKLSRAVRVHPEWFAPLAGDGGERCGVEPLLDVLRRTAGSLRTSGHSTIYLATALSVLARRPERIDARLVDGLLSLHAAGREDDPARYFGIDDYFERVDHAGEVAGRGGAVSTEATRIAIASLGHLVSDRSIDGRRYFLFGEKIHLLTHAHAIATFEGLGYADIARSALRAQSDLARMVEPSHALPATPIEPAGSSPCDARFWGQEVPDPLHLVKLAEAVVELLPRLGRADRRVALERMPRLWTLLGIR